jgi:hypothetical protein
MRQPGVVDSPIAEVGGNPVHREEAGECAQSPAGLVGEDASGSEQRGSNSGDAKSSSTSTSGSSSGSSGQSTHSSRTSVARSDASHLPRAAHRSHDGTFRWGGFMFTPRHVSKESREAAPRIGWQVTRSSPAYVGPPKCTKTRTFMLKAAVEAYLNRHELT